MISACYHTGRVDGGKLFNPIFLKNGIKGEKWTPKLGKTGKKVRCKAT
jgi:hypothetical protein